MLPNTQPRKRKNSSKVNLIISFIFHAVLVVAIFYFAARQGWLGEPLKKISIEMVKSKPPEKAREPEKPKVVVPKIETPKITATPKLTTPKAVAPAAATTVAPPPAQLPPFDFEGGKTVISSSDPVELYKSALESAFRSHWNRPDDMADDHFVAEVQIAVGRDGEVSNPIWKKSSGNSRWDDSVRQAIAAVTNLNRPPPTNFPPRVTIRFDVQDETESVLQ